MGAMLFSDMTLGRLETKAVADGDEVAHFAGVASTSDIDLVDDIIEPGAFGKIVPKDVALLRDHVGTQCIGGWTGFEQDGKHLRVEGDISLAIPLGRETYTLMKQGFLSGISVGYRIRKGGMAFDEASGVRRIKKATLVECSIVAVPANRGARVRSVKSLLGSPAELHEWLADAGFDDREIDVVISRGFDALRRDERGALRIHGVDGFGRLPTDDQCSALAEAVRGLVNDVRQPNVHS